MKVKFLRSATLTTLLAASLSLAQANQTPVTATPAQGGGGCAAGSTLVDGQCVVTTTVAPVVQAQAQEQQSSVPTEGADQGALTAAPEEAETASIVVSSFEKQVEEVALALAQKVSDNKEAPAETPVEDPVKTPAEPEEVTNPDVKDQETPPTPETTDPENKTPPSLEQKDPNQVDESQTNSRINRTVQQTIQK